jgi:hypothetical protein
MTDPAERQHNNWKKWYDKHCDEYNHMRSIQRDIKRGFIVHNSVHRQRPETNKKIADETPTLVEAKPRTKMTATEIRRRKIVLELEKVEKRRQEWAMTHP